MRQYLMGNYPLRKGKNAKSKRKVKTITKEFEERALGKLGGSIAFVTKPGSFIWSGKNEKVK